MTLAAGLLIILKIHKGCIVCITITSRKAINYVVL